MPTNQDLVFACDRALAGKGVSQIGTSIGNHITGKGKVLRSTVRDIDAGR
jgi:hypothetical protein